MPKYLDMPGLTYFYNQIKNKFASKTDVSTPSTASTIAAMTNTNKVYVYTGSESGHTFGDWYYYEDGSWHSGGQYQANVYETDKTLTIENRPADAKKTGNEIADLKSAVDDSVIRGTAIINGTFNQNGTADGSAIRVRTKVFAVNKGDVVQITNNNLTHGVAIWSGSISSGNIVRYDNSITHTSEIINIEQDGYFVCAFRKTDNSNITPSECDSIVEIKKNTYARRVESALNTSMSVDENNYKLPVTEIYGSVTDNYLDVDNVIYGMCPVSGTWEYSDVARMSRLIPIKGATQITISGYGNINGSMAVYFLDDGDILKAPINSSHWYNLTGTSRTITFPTKAIYAIVGLRNKNNPSFDYSNMKVSLSSTAAQDEFSPVFSHIRNDEYLLKNNNLLTYNTQNLLEIDKCLSDYRVTDVSPYFLQAAGCVISNPIYVDGQSAIRIKSSNIARNRRWIACMKSREMIADNVIAVRGTFEANATGDEKDWYISLPIGTKWIYICVKPPNSESNWTNDIVTFQESDDEYEKNVYGLEYNGDIYTIPIPNAWELSKIAEAERVNKIFTPYTVGTNADTISFSGQTNRCNLLFFSDSHIDYRNVRESAENVKTTINFANSTNYTINAVIHGGDAITPSGVNDKNYAKNLFNPFWTELKKSKSPVIFTKGNHDLNDWGNTPANTFDDSDWSEMWYDYAEQTIGIVRQVKSNGAKSTWHYFDINEHKIRIIALDSQDTDKTAVDNSGNVLHYGGKSWYMSNEQLNWLASTALNFDDKSDKGWGVIVVTHQNVTYATYLSPAFESSIQKAFDLCVAFNTQSTYSNSYTFASNSFYNINVSADFTRYASLSEKPHMICWLFGHEHYDKNETVNGVNKIWIANGSCTNYSSDQRLARVPRTSTQNLFDLINIDTIHRKIRIVRYGAGVNCYGNGGDRFLPEGLSY